MPSVVQAESQQNKGQEGDARVTASLKELFRRASTVQPLSLSIGRQPAAGQIPVNAKERNEPASERGVQLREIQASQGLGMVARSEQGGTGSSASSEVYHYVHQGGKPFFWQLQESPGQLPLHSPTGSS